MKFVPPQLSFAAVIQDDGMAIRSELSRPRRIGEWLTEQHLPGDAVQHVEEAVAGRDDDNLAALTSYDKIRQHRHMV